MLVWELVGVPELFQRGVSEATNWVLAGFRSLAVDLALWSSNFLDM